MHLESLAADLILPAHAKNVVISGLTADSRAVRDGFLFAALKGAKTDGVRFVEDALASGAAAILVDADGAERLAGKVPETVPVLVSEEPRRTLALMAARFAGRQPKTMVAVTGTAGKTSVVHFVRQIFQAAGHASASLGTIGTVTSTGQSYGGLTTPDPVALQTNLAKLAGDGITHAALEASSHGLDQHRLDGVLLTAAGFTNLGRDHLDYHADVEEYLTAKLRLFRDLLPSGGTVVADPGEPYADRVLAVAEERGLRVITVGETGQDLKLTGLRQSGFSQVLTIATERGDYDITLPLAGRFQVQNALIAAGLCMAAGEETGAVLRALENLKGAPGRLDFVGAKPSGAMGFVDYAHKPDALENALAALRPFTAGRLFVVVGAGGDRDPGKRPLMGAAAHKHADVVIITDDNPRSEDPATIRAAVMEAAPGARDIGDRATAIRTAVAEMTEGDVLCVAGKGHETGQIVGDTILPFSDHETLLAALTEDTPV